MVANNPLCNPVLKRQRHNYAVFGTKYVCFGTHVQPPLKNTHTHTDLERKVKLKIPNPTPHPKSLYAILGTLDGGWGLCRNHLISIHRHTHIHACS